MIKLPEMSDTERDAILSAFTILCTSLGKTCIGFDVDGILKKDEWALTFINNPHEESIGRWGWMIVSGRGGCGAAVTRFNGYISSTWDMIIAMEMATEVAQLVRNKESK